jgi:hypothetical protein
MEGSQSPKNVCRYLEEGAQKCTNDRWCTKDRVITVIARATLWPGLLVYDRLQSIRLPQRSWMYWWWDRGVKLTHVDWVIFTYRRVH